VADYAFDTCFPFPLTTTIERATVGSDRAQGFAAKRAVYERGRRLVEWSGEVGEGYADYIVLLHKLTSGGVKNIDFTAPDTGDSFEVCFARQPDIRSTKSGHGKVRLSFQLEEVL
jgi:hypothetical protein